MSRQRGDTLIEVMIALAIVATVISISYATASRALRTGQAAQERTEALKLAEGQIETLKSAAAAPLTKVFGTSGPSSPTDPSFCVGINSAVTGGVYTEQLTASKAADINLDNLQSGTIPSALPAGPEYDDAHCALGAGKRYKVSVVRIDVNNPIGPTIESTFIVRVRWERIGGGKDEVALYYRLHRGMF